MCIGVWVLLFAKRLKYKKAFLITASTIAYLICVLTSGYGLLIDSLGFANAYKLWEMILCPPYNSIFSSVPYFAIGYWFAKNEEHIFKLNNVIILAVFVLSATLLITEGLLLDKYGFSRTSDIYLFLLPTAVSLFAFILKIDVKIKYNLVLRKISTINYFSHFIWVFIFEFVEYTTSIFILSYVKFLLVVLCSLFTSIAFLKLQKFRVFNWIRNFY